MICISVYQKDRGDKMLVTAEICSRIEVKIEMDKHETESLIHYLSYQPKKKDAGGFSMRGQELADYLEETLVKAVTKGDK